MWNPYVKWSRWLSGLALRPSHSPRTQNSRPCILATPDLLVWPLTFGMDSGTKWTSRCTELPGVNDSILTINLPFNWLCPIPKVKTNASLQSWTRDPRFIPMLNLIEDLPKQTIGGAAMTIAVEKNSTLTRSSPQTLNFSFNMWAYDEQENRPAYAALSSAFQLSIHLRSNRKTFAHHLGLVGSTLIKPTSPTAYETTKHCAQFSLDNSPST